MSTIPVAEILQDPSGLARRVKAGESLVVVEDGQTLAEIKPRNCLRPGNRGRSG